MLAMLKLGIAIAIIIGVVISTYTVTIPPLSKYIDDENDQIVRIGYFATINHAQAIIGIAKGDFQNALGDVEIKTKVFNAGPSAIEALFAKEIDIAYVGPNPAINGYIRSNGEALKIIAGAASGGVVFVVRNDSNINSVKDFNGKVFASPQLGNTQDVALRSFVLKNGYDTRSVTIKPAKLADIFMLMIKREIDGAWVPEPWGAKLVREANGRIFLDERDLWPNGRFVTAHVIVRSEFLKEHPEVVERFIKVHVDETNWINSNLEEASKILNKEFERLTGEKIDEEELRDALSRIEFTYDPIRSSLLKTAEDAFELGFLDERPDLSNMYDLTLLNKILVEYGYNPIE